MDSKPLKLITTKSKLTELLKEEELDEVIIGYKTLSGYWYCNWTDGLVDEELSYAVQFLANEVSKNNFGG